MTKESSPHAIKHAKLLDISMKPGEGIIKNKELVGKIVKWRITKGKAGVHEGASGEIKYHFATGFDRADDLANVMKGFGIVHHAPRAQTFDLADHLGEVVLEGGTWGEGGIGVADALYAAVTREFPTGGPEGGWHGREKVTIEQALAAQTLGAAYAEFREADQGSLEPGKLADLAILSDDVLAARPPDLLATRAEMALLGGQIVFERERR